MCRKAQFMPKAIHESMAFNSRNREVAIHCVFSVKDNTHCSVELFYINLFTLDHIGHVVDTVLFFCEVDSGTESAGREYFARSRRM